MAAYWGRDKTDSKTIKPAEPAPAKPAGGAAAKPASSSSTKAAEPVAAKPAGPPPAAKAAEPAPAAKAAGSGATKPTEQTATIRYVDRPDCGEIFADSINHVYFDGQSLRVEFGVTRLDEVKPNATVTGRRYPAQRMVLTPAAAVELINRMQQVGAALVQSGVVKATPNSPPAEPSKN
jgi:hypothetical protein